MDAGNTVLHAGLFRRRRLIRQGRFPTAAVPSDFRGLVRFFRRMRARRKPPAAVASVVPALNRRIRSALLRCGAGPVRFLRPPAGLRILYRPAAAVGADRIANALAARAKYGAPCVVVDFGTATTVDVIGPQGEYRGGAIAPGPATSLSALAEKTAKLPRVRPARPRHPIGRTTRQAILSGVFYGQAGLVEALLARIRRRLGGRRIPVLATGGFARHVAPLCPSIRRVDPALTLEGIRLWACRRPIPVLS